MKRAVVVLILLIANAIVSSKANKAREPALPDRPEYSLGLFTVVDGAGPAKRTARSTCPSTSRLVWSSDSGDEASECRTGEDSSMSSFDVRL